MVKYTILFFVNSIRELVLIECFFVAFCKTLVFAVKLWLRLINEYSSNMNVVDIFGYLMSKMKMKQKKTYAGTLLTLQ